MFQLIMQLLDETGAFVFYAYTLPADILLLLRRIQISFGKLAVYEQF
jgi:hypothetical protein